MRSFFSIILSKTKNQPIDIWFFFLFLLTFPLSVRKVMLYFPIERTFNEYAGIYIYLSDIFLTLAIGSWLFILLYNKRIIPSNYKLWITTPPHQSNFTKNKNLPKFQCLIKRLLCEGKFHRLYIFLPLLLVIWSFISISWSQNQIIAVFRSIKLLEFYLLYLYIIFRFIPKCSVSAPSASNVPRGTLEVFTGWNIFLWTIIITGFVQSCLGIAQFISQKSLGLTLLRESAINPDIPGVAKIVLNGEKYIRSYGLFPHPNILGGFLVFSIILTILYLKLHKNIPQLNLKECNGSIAKLLYRIKKTLQNKMISRSRTNVKQLSLFTYSDKRLGNGMERNLNQNFSSKRWFSPIKWLIIAILLVQILALLLTFSKSAILGLAIGLVYISYKLFRICPAYSNYSTLSPRIPNVPTRKDLRCSTWNIWDARGVEHLAVKTKEAFHNFISFIRFGIQKFFRIKNYRITTLIGLILIVLAWIIFQPDLNSLFFKSLNERMFYLNVPRLPAGEAGGTFLSYFFHGTGAGQFVLSLPLFYQKVILSWQYQPIHNVFLLIWAELGIIGLGLFIWFIWKIFNSKNNYKKSSLYILDNKYNNLSSNITPLYFKTILLAFIFVMLFDHYFWDIQQGSLMLWTILGFIAGIRKKQ